MKVKRKATILYSNNIGISKDFYMKVLGFEVEMDLSSVVFFKEGVAIWEVKPGHLLREKLGENFNKPGSAKFELYFEITDWENFVQKLKEQKIKYLHEVHEETWGQKTVRFLDPDENIIEIGEPLEVFIRRMYDDGISIESIAKRNEISTEEVNKILNS